MTPAPQKRFLAVSRLIRSGLIPFIASVVLLIATLPLFFVDLSQLFGGMPPPQEFSQFAHVGFFALLTLLALLALRGRTPVRISVTLAALFFIGVAIEAAQELSGREASVRDVLLNTSGIVLGLGLFQVASRPQLTAVTIAIAGITLARPTIDLWDRWQAYQQFPVLSDFSTRFEHRRWSYGERIQQPDGQHALRVSLAPDSFPGTWMHRSLGDWRGQDCLHLLLKNPEDEAFDFTISIRDHAHEARGARRSDRFRKSFELPPGRHRIDIPTSIIREAPEEREMDLGQVSRLVLLTPRPDSPRQFFVERVFLSPNGAESESPAIQCKFSHVNQ